eukprot:TRINITY_DN16816_c0_g1_i2.p1 TRINITY_DN16816_c0_g1~~TRINITY_DN16816_c0_g1_i2.p1  ORF type:complete len:517 (+),score=95.59 TRINITY_DN16816_c0_g1_i2:46-1596(+)
MKQSKVRLLVTSTQAGWFKPPPERKKFHFCQAVCNVPGFPEDKPKEDPYWMDSAITGNWRYKKRGPNVASLKHGATAWKGDAEKGIPAMPPADYFGNKLIPRDEAAKFLPDIHIDGLAEEITGPIRTLGRHVVPHQFHEYYDESLVVEGLYGKRSGDDKSREKTWKANLSMYLHRHPMADEMQRKMLIGDAEAQDRYQDPDDVEYEEEIIAALKHGDIDTACSIYKKLVDPPKNWHIYTLMVNEFVTRGLLSDAISVYNEMQIYDIPPDAELFSSILSCAIAAEHPKRVTWLIGEARKIHSNGVTIPKDGLAQLCVRAVRYLLEADPRLAVRIYKIMEIEDLLSMHNIDSKAAALLLKARELGILPETDPMVGGHHHRYVYSLPSNGATRNGDENVVQDGGERGEFGFGLSSEEVERVQKLMEEEEGERDVQLPYFKKSQPNHPLQPSVVKEYRYSLVQGTHSTDVPYPCKRDWALSNSSSSPENRYTFRWNGRNTRMVSVSASETPVTTSPEIWF